MNGIDLKDANFDVENLNIERDKKYIIYLNAHSGDNKVWCVQTLERLKDLMVEKNLDTGNIIYTIKVDDVPLFEIKEEE